MTNDPNAEKKSHTLFTVPAGAKPTNCRDARCGALIYFVKQPSEKFMPIDCDRAHGGRVPTETQQGAGISHYATCPGAADFRRSNAQKKG